MEQNPFFFLLLDSSLARISRMDSMMCFAKAHYIPFSELSGKGIFISLAMGVFDVFVGS